MKIFDKLLRAMDRVAQGGLEKGELTAIFPLRSDNASARRKTVSTLLSVLDAREPSPYLAVRGVHAARWVLLHSPGDDSSPGPLLCSLVFDGDADEVLAAMVDALGPLLAPLLDNCADFPSNGSAVAQVKYWKQHRVHCGYLFGDHRTRTRAEIEQALMVRQSFEDFYAEHQSSPVAVVRREFEQFRAGRWAGADAEAPQAGFQIGQASPLSQPFERRQPQEEAWTRRAVELTARQQRRQLRSDLQSDPNARALRMAHAKHHGCVHARFVVRDDLPVRYQHGIFQPGRSFDAVLRFSNTSNQVRKDSEFDGRGVALKVLDVGDFGRAVVDGIPDGLPDAGVTQDFLMLSSPNFFAKDIREFAIFRSILDIGTAAERALRATAFFLVRPHQLSVLARTLLRRVNHPLNVVYHSATASLLGAQQVVKYSLRAKAPFDEAESERSDPNFLRAALQRTLHPRGGRTVELEFSIHVPRDHLLSVEDATLNWDRHGAERIPVATVYIEPQNFVSQEALERCDGLVFSPWHALDAHKPLGSLNRGRLSIYRESSKGRRDPAAPVVHAVVFPRPMTLTPVPVAAHPSSPLPPFPQDRAGVWQKSVREPGRPDAE